MKTLYRLLARLLWVPFLLFTLLGCAMTVWAKGDRFSVTGTDVRIFPWLCFAAASFGGRVFYGRIGERDGVYLRSLPIRSERVSLHALTLASIFTLASFGIQATVALLFGEFDSPASPFGPWTGSELGLALLIAMMILVGSAYFSCSLPHLGSARQGGLPGFFLSLWWAIAATELSAALGLGPAWIPAVVLAGLTLVGLPHLAALRSVGAQHDFEETMARVSPSVRRGWLLLQGLWLVVPMVSFVHHRGPLPASPFLRTPAWVLDVLLWLAIGAIATLLRRRTVRQAIDAGSPRLTTWALHLSGVGLPLWRIHTLGRVGSPAETPLSSGLHRRVARIYGGMSPRTPWGYVGLWFASWFLVIFPLGGQRVVRAWTLEVDTPGVELWVDGEPVDGNSLSGVRLAAPRGPWMGGMSGSGSRGRTGGLPGLPTDAISLGALFHVDSEPESDRTPGDEDHDASMELAFPPIEEFLPPGLEVDLRYRGAPVQLADVYLRDDWGDFHVAAKLVLSARVPGVDACVEHLERRVRDGEAPTDDDMARAAALGPVLREPLAERVHSLALEVTGKYGLSRTEGAVSTPANLLAPVLGHLDWIEAEDSVDPVAALEEGLGDWRMRSPEDDPWVFEVELESWVAVHTLACALRSEHPGALGYAEAHLDLVHPEVLLAVGFAGRREFVPTLRGLLTSEPDRALLCALARLDPEATAASVSERLMEDPRAEWVDALAACIGDGSRTYITELLREFADATGSAPALVRHSARHALGRIESGANPLQLWRIPES